MKCTECNNTLHKTIGEFSMSIDGKTIKVINAPILHCKNCDLVVVDDEIKNNAKEFAKIYLSDNILDYAEYGRCTTFQRGHADNCSGIRDF